MIPANTLARRQMAYGSSPQVAVDLTDDDDAGAGAGMKRKRELAGYASQPSLPSSSNNTLPDWHQEPSESPAKKAKKKKDPPGEKRRRRFRPQAPKDFGDTYHRATTQRFYVLERRAGGTADCPEQVVELTGSTGNIYTVRVGLEPTCDCPHGAKGNQCKHMVFVSDFALLLCLWKSTECEGRS